MYTPPSHMVLDQSRLSTRTHLSVFSQCYLGILSCGVHALLDEVVHHLHVPRVRRPVQARMAVHVLRLIQDTGQGRHEEEEEEEEEEDDDDDDDDVMMMMMMIMMPREGPAPS
jgi:hypothetical protein